MRGPEGRGRHAQRMTRPQRPESWRLQRVGVGEGWGAGVGKPSWLPEMTLSFIEGFPISSTISGKTSTRYPSSLCTTLPQLCLHCQGLDSGVHSPALWPSPLPVSRALSVRSPRALMSRKGLFPMPIETICCTRSSREQRPCYQPPFAPSLLQP